MAESTGFTHITVTPDEDDDIVIQAGIVADEPRAEEPCAELIDDGVSSEDVAFASGTKPEEALETPSVERAVKSDDGYRATSLEDLQGTKMSTTQKAVIVVAVLGIVAFVAWYLLLAR